MAELIFNIDNTALEAVKTLQITANFEEMETALNEVVMPYKNLVVTEDGIAQAKTDRARLRKLSNNIDDRRKLVKNLYSEPLKLFEEKCKRLTTICAQGINNLDDQVKEYEARAKAQKIKDLTDYFDNLEKKNPAFIRFEDVVNPKWTNATYPIEVAQTEIENYVMKIDMDVESIKALGSKYESMLLDEYKKTKDVSAVLMLKKRAEDAEKAAEAKKAAEQKPVEIPLPEEPEPQVTPFKLNYKEKYITVRCTNTEDEASLVQFCTSRGMTLMYGREK